LTSENLAGSTAGIIMSASPARPSVYAYRDSARWSRTMASAAAATRIAMTVQSSWRNPSPANGEYSGRTAALARPRSSRRRKDTPSPLSSATHGRIAGSAYGARKRTTTCATRNTIVSSRGSTQKSEVTFPISPYSYAAVYAVTMIIANSSPASSALRRVGARRSASALGAGGGAGFAVAAVTLRGIPPS
jgi:hypothetical protein